MNRPSIEDIQKEIEKKRKRQSVSLESDSCRDRSFPPRGSNHWKAKITEKDVLKIRRMIKDKVPIIKIAEKFKITRQAVYDVKRGDTWNWM